MGKEKKKHKKKQSSKRSKSKKSSSSEEEWVEMNPVPPTPVVQLGTYVEREKQEERSENDDWLMNPAFLACKSRDEIRQKRENNKDKKEHDKYMLDKLGQTNRELNPYWKDGGTGLPQEVQVVPESLRQASVTVGDQGVAWLRKALQRAKEQAAEQGRSLEQVVAERWGSLDKLESMITAAEEREKKVELSFQNNSKYRHDSSKSTSKCSTRKNRNEDQSQYSHINEKKTESNEAISERKSYQYNERGTKTNRIKYEQNPQNRSQLFKKPKESDDNSSDDKHKHSAIKKTSSEKQKSNKTDNHYGRSSEENERLNRKDDKRNSKRDVSKKKHSSKISASTSSSSEEGRHHKKYKRDVRRDTLSKKKQSRRRYERSSSSSSDSSDYSSSESKKGAKMRFIKPHNDSDDNSVESSNQRQSYKQKEHSSSSQGWRKKTQSPSKDCVNVCDKEQESSIQESTDNVEVSQKSPIEIPQVLTDKEMNDLGAKLVKAELLGNEELARELKTKLDRAREDKANLPNDSKQSEEMVLLTHTDSKGFTRPISLSGSLEPAGGRRKSKKVETHSDGKRMRYFADDDKYSLQEMFQREKLSTVEDSNAVFAKLASKGVGRDDSARDMDDVFEETARVEEVDGRKHARERQQAIEQSKRTARSLDNCQWCLESKQMLKHLIVAMGRTCYLCVPPYQSLTDNHCLLVPSYHTPCATQLDEDVWREMQDFRKSVVQMFLSQDEDVVFFESARTLNKFPHMVINCVPMPKETGDLAPIYFKKAIQECEMEWSNNKKLVELKGRDVRKAVPRGLPYFAVDFGMESGFAHVIEDEKLFPQNFAQEIIGGMLDLDHTIWRKQRKQTFEEQSRKVIQLTKLWNPFDCTK